MGHIRTLIKFSLSLTCSTSLVKKKKIKPNGYESSRQSRFCNLKSTVVNLYCNGLCQSENIRGSIAHRLEKCGEGTATLNSVFPPFSRKDHVNLPQQKDDV